MAASRAHGASGKDTVLRAAPGGILLALLWFFVDTLQTLVLLICISMVNVVGLYLAERIGGGLGAVTISSSNERTQTTPATFSGKLFVLASAMFSGIILQRSQLSLSYLLFCVPFALFVSSAIELWNPAYANSAAMNGHLTATMKADASFARMTPDRQWLSLILHAIIKHVSPMPVAQFDIGGQVPVFSTRSYVAKPEGKGFSATVDFVYKSDDNTKIEIEIPMDVPLWGTLTVPVMVAQPEVALAVQLDISHELIANSILSKGAEGHAKVLAISFMFEPIKEIHIHGIHISMASQFQLIQYIPLVKSFMKKAVDSALAPGVRKVLLFDSGFGSLGSFELKEDELWNIEGLLQKAHVTNLPNDDKNRPPVLDVAHSDPEKWSSFDASSSSSPEPLFPTEMEADIPPNLMPGHAKELPTAEAQKYPRLQL